MKKEELKSLIKETIDEVKEEKYIALTKETIEKTKEFIDWWKTEMKKDGYDIK
jgi:sugar-specific transcriptional regulator TrmB